MTRQALIAGVAVLILAPGAARAAAQDSYPTPPAHVSAVEGSAVLERDGRPDAEPASMPLLAGDRLRTERGRVEVMFGDGSLLYLDAGTSVDFQSEEVLRLTAGRLRLTLASGGARFFRIDTPAGWVQIDEPGDYRIGLPVDRDGEVELAVLRGRASLLNEDGRTDLQAGERAFARAGLAPSVAYVFNSAALDAFDAWAEGRHRAQRALSVQYLPETVRPYAATFDRYGSWNYEPTYGYVWYPTVQASWRPYYRGRWMTYASFGWTWVGSDPWAWPTHHYGRWGINAGRWYWIPGRQWGPAWVSWAYSPGYVSWCPLGFNNRAVLGFGAGGAYGAVYTGRGYDPWRAWTVLPAGRFGAGFVHTNVVVAGRLPSATRSAFVVRDRGPEIRGYAVPRSATPLYVAGGRAGVGGRANSSGGSAVDRRGAVTRPPDARATSDFRSRGHQATPTGPGLPAPARAPRATSPIENRPAAAAPRAVPRAGAAYDARGAVPVSPRQRPSTAVAPSAPAPGVIRRTPPPADSGTPAPARGNIRSRQAGDAAPANPYDARGSYEARGAYDARRTPEPTPSAVPRGSRGGGYDARPTPPATPSTAPRGSGGTSDARGLYEAAPDPGGRSRSVLRSSPANQPATRPASPSAAPPAGAMRRSAPAPRASGASGAPSSRSRSTAGAPAAAAPPRAGRPDSGRASAPASTGGSRNSGGQSQGQAVRRGGRGGE